MGTRALLRYPSLLSADDVESEVQYQFVLATHSFPGGDFEDWVCSWVWRELQELARTAARRRRLLADAARSGLFDRPGTADKPDILAGLGWDAATAVWVLISDPGFTPDCSTKPETIRAGLRKVLAGMGWGKARTDAAFDELSKKF